MVCLHSSPLVYGSEVAAPIRNRAPSVQPHCSSSCCHTNPATGKPKQGRKKCSDATSNTHITIFHLHFTRVPKGLLTLLTDGYSCVSNQICKSLFRFTGVLRFVSTCLHLFCCVCVFQEKVQLQYRLTFTMGEQEHSESGSLEQFPPPETWGNL